MDREQQQEQKKVEFIYNFCEVKQIPITVHCQNSSFGTIPKKIENKNTNPVKWKPILVKYPDLTLNFAHMGLVDKGPPPPIHEWADTIAGYMKKKTDENKPAYPNIYADFACKGRIKGSYDFYAFFSSLLKKYEDDGLPDIKNRIIFGSDFPMQLFEDCSYKTYISCFLGTKESNFSDQDKKLFYNINPAKFVFSKKV
jgi:predicted TIM-barrel fold metal-dependent hydrolase